MIKDALTLNFSKKWFCGECNSGNHTILIILRWLKAPYFPYLLENILNYQNYLWPVYLLGTKTGAMVNFSWRWLFFSNNGMAMVFENFSPSPSMVRGGINHWQRWVFSIFSLQFWGPIVQDGYKMKFATNCV